MDTNYLLKREQVSLMMAARAVTPEARCAHAGLARLYGKMLSEGQFPHRPFRVALPDRDNARRERIDA